MPDTDRLLAAITQLLEEPCDERSLKTIVDGIDYFMLLMIEF